MAVAKMGDQTQVASNLGYFDKLKSLTVGNKSTWANSISLFDNLRAIAIFAICFRHASGHDLFGEPGPYLELLAKATGLFAIPVFAFASGYGQKNLTDNSYFARFLSIYFAANIINIPYYLWESHHSGFHVWLYALILGPAGTSGVYIWYFLAILFWRLLSPFFLQMRYPLALSLIFAITCTPDLMILMKKWSGTQESELINAVLRPLYFTIKFFPFYLAGLLATRDHILWLRNFRAKVLLLPVMLAGLYLCGKNYVAYYSFPDDVRAHSIAYFLLAFVTLAAFVAFVPGKPISWMTFLGQRSFAIYFLHILFIEMLVMGMRALHLTPNASFAGPVVAVAIAACVTYIISYILSRKPFVNFVQFASQQVERILFIKQHPVR